MKKFAIFLPQFHEIPENDKWWGKGFTEWTNVKKATPLFKGHKQPVIPLNNYYYNLLDKRTVEWQTDLMNKYGIDGFIYYHYYFKGKLLLEKPAENLYKWKDIDQPFFFCWANHPWIRSWEGRKDVLMPMEYGSQEDWEKHFQYLLPFFKDNRYEKKDNKPLFMIFESDFKERNQLFKYFDKRCKDEGFDGLCLIETWEPDIKLSSWKSFERCPVTQYLYLRDPGFARYLYNRRTRYSIQRIIRGIWRRLAAKNVVKQPLIFNGDDFLNLEINELKNDKELLDKGVIHGAFFAWDNTPRHKRRGYIINSVSKKKFLEYMALLKNEEYVFFNAWNEWAEGMIMEPTEQNNYKYLEWIKCI